MSTKERPTGIIRTLPSLGPDHVGHYYYEMSIKAIEQDRLDAVYIAMPCIPTKDVLHMYLIVEGKIEVRLNIAGYEPGDARKCWDRAIRKPKFWAVCTGPVSRPEDPITRRGFQGFRYTGDLW